MEISVDLSDEAVLGELGRRLAQRRLALRLSQAELAEQAGVGKRTVERVEAGASVQLTNWIRLLRVLELLPAVNAMIPVETVRPMTLLEQGGKLSRRVRRRDKTKKPAPEPWSWDDTE